MACFCTTSCNAHYLALILIGVSFSYNRGCAKLLVAFHLAAADDHLCAVYRKFSKPDRGVVAHFTQAKALLE